MTIFEVEVFRIGAQQGEPEVEKFETKDAAEDRAREILSERPGVIVRVAPVLTIN